MIGDKITINLPKKCAIPYWGVIADLERGWQICDGTNDTPDLRDQFIRGARTDSQVGDTYTDTTAQPNNVFSAASTSHTHNINPPATNTSSDSHVHTINPPVTNTSANDISNNFQGMNASRMNYMLPVWETSSPVRIDYASTGGLLGNVNTTLDDMYIDSGADHNHSVDIAPFNSSSDTHYHTVDIANFTSGSNAHGHVISGGDAETAPQHILMYWITYTGSLASNW